MGYGAGVRVVSLLASSTETVCALGFRDALVGRSHECDHPASVLALPAITWPKFPYDGTSLEIDQRLKAILQEGLAVYRVDADHLARLAPDLILTQTQCEVCAVSLKDVEGALADYVGSRPRVVSLEPNRLDDVWRDMQRVAEALGVPARGEALVAGLRARMDAIARVARPRVTVAVVEWIDPLMAAGNWMPELITLAGGESLFGVAGAHSPWMTFAELAAKDPDVLLVSPCGFDLARTRAEMPVLDGNPAWTALRAVGEGRVFLADGNQFFHRPGPRLVESLEILVEILHDGGRRHEGTGWERYSAKARTRSNSPPSR